MFIKYFSMLTIFFTILFLVFFSIKKMCEEYIDDDLVRGMYEICFIGAIFFGALSLSVYLVWGYV